MKQEVVILAGGRGERIKEVLEDAQKCMVPVDDKPIIGHVLQTLVEAFGSIDAKVTVGYKAEEVVDYLNRNRPSNATITYLYDDQQGGPLGACLNAESSLHGNFLLVSGDMLAVPSVYQAVLAQYESEQAEVMVGASSHLEIADSHPLLKLSNGSIVDFTYPPPKTRDLDHLRDLTIYGTGMNIYEFVQRYSLPRTQPFAGILVKMFEENIPLAGIQDDNPWIHIAYPNDLFYGLPGNPINE